MTSFDFDIFLALDNREHLDASSCSKYRLYLTCSTLHRCNIDMAFRHTFREEMYRGTKNSQVALVCVGWSTDSGLNVVCHNPRKSYSLLVVVTELPFIFLVY